jgi:hypothetical protein
MTMKFLILLTLLVIATTTAFAPTAHVQTRSPVLARRSVQMSMGPEMADALVPSAVFLSAFLVSVMQSGDPEYLKNQFASAAPKVVDEEVVVVEEVAVVEEPAPVVAVKNTNVLRNLMQSFVQRLRNLIPRFGFKWRLKTA